MLQRVPLTWIQRLSRCRNSTAAALVTVSTCNALSSMINSRFMSRTPWWCVVAPVVVGATFLALTALERRRPLRRVREAKWRHVSRNIVVAGAAAATVNLLERPVVEPLANAIERRRCGLLYVCRLPPPLHLILAVVLLDYTLYLWHVLTHRVSWLWRVPLGAFAGSGLDAAAPHPLPSRQPTLPVPSPP